MTHTWSHSNPIIKRSLPVQTHGSYNLFTINKIFNNTQTPQPYA